jgi:ankyrin repeat protein
MAGHTSVVQVLLEAGANPSLRNKEGNTALEVAHAFGRHTTAEVLRVHSSTPTSEARRLTWPSVVFTDTPSGGSPPASSSGEASPASRSSSSPVNEDLAQKDLLGMCVA